MPGRKSTIEGHPKLGEIQDALRNGVPATAVAERFGLSRSAVGRYRAHNLDRPDPAAPQSDADHLMAQLRELYDQAASFLKRAGKSGNTKDALASIKEARATLALIAKAMGMLRDSAQVNVGVGVTVDVNCPPGDLVRGAIFRALDRYPEARQAVVAELKVLAAGWRPSQGGSDG